MQRAGLLYALIAALMTGAAAPKAAVPAVGPTAAWSQVVADDGQVIGYAYRDIVPRPDGGRDIVEGQEITVTNDVSPLTRIASRTVRREDAAGRTYHISIEGGIGSRTITTEAVITPGEAVITRRAGDLPHVTRVPLPAGVRFDGGDGLLAAWDPAAAPRLEFQRLDVDALGLERVVIEAPPGRPLDADGRVQAFRWRYDGRALVGVSRLAFDPVTHSARLTQPMFGAAISFRPTDRATALAPHKPYRAFAQMMTKSPFRIPDGALAGHVRYRFGFRDGMRFPLPQTAEQKVTVTGDEAVVDICAACGPGLETDPAMLADALKPTAWLQSDHPRIRAIAAPVKAMKVSDARRMEILTARTGDYFPRLDFNGHYSALDTLKRRAGDCTEAAVLLAALGRAAGIPTLVVNGLVYSRERYHGVSNVFMPHSWVLAYVDGGWRSYDAALFTFDATHIALTIGDGDGRSVAADGQLASLLLWNGMTEVRARPAP